MHDISEAKQHVKKHNTFIQKSWDCMVRKRNAKNVVIPEPYGPWGGADLRFLSP